MSATVELGRAPRRLPRAVAQWCAVYRVPLIAFAVSRLLVYGAGIGGAKLLTLHASAGEVARARALGPLGFLLASSADRFDATYYLNIAAHGYGAPGSVRVAFFPVYPLLIRIVGTVVGSPVAGGMLVSAAALLAALLMLHRLCELELGRGAADATALLLCFAPLSFFFTAIYTEAPFLALTVGSLLAARLGRWRLACALAAVATLTRPTGIVVAGALLVARLRRERRLEPGLAWLLAVPAALAGWMFTLQLAGYGWMSEFHAEQEHWHRLSVFPLKGLLLGILGIAKGVAYVAHGGVVYHPTITGMLRPYAADILLGAILLASLAALEACRRLLSAELTVYAGLALLMLLSSPERGEPLWCFDRFVLVIFPLWMVAGALVARWRLQIPAVLLGGLALVVCTAHFASWTFLA